MSTASATMRRPDGVVTASLPAGLQLALCLILGMALSLTNLTDANWDLQNYHLYNPWALLQGRLGVDYYATGYQAYFNPLVDLPYYLLKTACPGAPRLVALLAGLPYGAMVFLVLRLAPHFVSGRGSALLAAALGLTGATILSEIGTSFGDLVAADFVLAALLCLLAEGPAAALAAGLLCGAGVALKLTAGLFAIPLTLMAIVLPGPVWRRLMLFAAGAVAGFLLAYGWWGWRLWQQFGNPFYPLFGTIFPSPWAMPFSGQDPRFFPKTIWQWLAYPFFWLQDKPGIVTELRLRDPRFALAYIAALAALAAGLAGRRPRRTTLALWLFFASGYIAWLLGFSILRYALPLEALCGLFLASVLQTLWPRRRMGLPLGLLLIICLAVTKPMDWGHIPYNERLVSAPLPILPAGTLLLVEGAPLGFILPGLTPSPAHIVRLDDVPPQSPEWAVLARLRARHAPVWLLTNKAGTASPGFSGRLARLGLNLDSASCRPVSSPLQPAIELCPLSASRF